MTKNTLKIINLLEWLITNYINQNMLHIQGSSKRNKELKKGINNCENGKKTSK